LGGAGGEYAVVEVDEHVGEDHEGEDEGGRSAPFQIVSYFLFHVGKLKYYNKTTIILFTILSGYH
jgi:hypothetical protein